MRVVLGIFFCWAFLGLDAGIRFNEISIDQALERARQENKLIFIDTYASWCAPCKVMDKVFAKEHIGDYFNQDFINVKIDMDGTQGPLMQSLYGVVWLPTLLILDESGEVLMKLDKVVTPGELIDYANEARLSRAAVAKSGLRSNPFPQGTSASNRLEDYNPEEKEEVVYVYDERESSGRPHIMYHEAYLHLQLMDGKYQKVVKKYLSTQTDWSTDKNVRFIYDFMDDVNSDLFKYFISHRLRFEEVIGKEKVQENLGHLINQRIEQGYPRPDLKEYIRLYSYIDKNKGAQSAYTRYLDKMLSEDQQLPYIKAASSYIKEVNPYDHQVMYRLVTLRQSRSDAEESITLDINLMNEAVILSTENHLYLSLLSELNQKNGDEAKAIEHMKNAVLHAPENMKTTYEQRLVQLERL